jgi:hypothetical protein
MGVISIDGANPFLGQSDPYVTSNMTADGESATTDYVFNGQLTGCSLEALFELRDGLVTSFDWKKDPKIIRNINIDGIQTATAQDPLVPVSLSFDNSSYKGSLGYTLIIRWSQKQEGDDDDDDDDELQLINKTWTVSEEENEKGCKTTTTNMSCVPNTNVPDHCDEAALAAATKWVSGNIQKDSLSNSLEKSTVDSESLTMNPITSEVKYTSVSSNNCGDQKKANTPAGNPDSISYTHCTESTTEYTTCEQGYNIVSTRHNGEVYKISGSGKELLDELNTSVISKYDGVQDFAGSFNEGGSLTYSFTTQVDGNGNPIAKPKTLIIDSQTISNSTSYNGATGLGSEIESSSKSINGSVFWLNSTGNDESVASAAGYTQSDLKAAMSAAGKRLTSWSYTNDPIANTASYSATLNSIPDDEDPSEAPALDGFSGVTSYSVAYTPPLGIYDLVPNMNCEDLVFKMGYTSKGSITISLNATSGSGYNFLEKGRECMDWLKKETTKNQQDPKVTADKEQEADDGLSASWTYSATFKGADALSESGNGINSMY